MNSFFKGAFKALDRSLPKLRIYHMASMARCGETLVLKILSAHSRICVIHNLEATDSKYNNRAFGFFKKYPQDEINRSHRILSSYDVQENQVLLLKQGVWEHQYPFKGFVLVRNPISIYSSLKSYDKDSLGYDPENNFWFNNEKRLTRWLRDMKPSLLKGFCDMPPIKQFALFYNQRMDHLASLGLPIFRYEDLINDPNTSFYKICQVIGLGFEPEILDAHRSYKKGDEGHGKNILSREIDKRSLYKYKENISNEEFDECSFLTEESHRNLGYLCKSGNILIQEG